MARSISQDLLEALVATDASGVRDSGVAREALAAPAWEGAELEAAARNSVITLGAKRSKS
jgi:hypothetical protein